MRLRSPKRPNAQTPKGPRPTPCATPTPHAPRPIPNSQLRGVGRWRLGVEVRRFPRGMGRRADTAGMPHIRPGGRLLAALVAVCLFPGAASAQEPANPLKLPTIAATLGSAADWATTYHALRNYHVREVNPLLRPMQSSPGRLITAGAAMDGVEFSAWNLTLGRDHPRIAAAGLWGTRSAQIWPSTPTGTPAAPSEKRRFGPDNRPIDESRD